MPPRLSCWHCLYYIRPRDEPGVDGPPAAVCTVGRAVGPYYADVIGLHPGDKHSPPNGWCPRFELDPPPELPEYGTFDGSRPATREQIRAYAYKYGKKVQLPGGEVINPNFEVADPPPPGDG
ncbi:MAG: hypothetical protein WCA32_10020 [Chromatiaceae bacterium]